MPVSKKPRAKKTERTPSRSGTAATPALPDRRAMERFLAAIGGRGGDDPTEKAQGVMYEAWEQTTSRSRIALARKALGISPLCADAYVLLAEEAARSVEEARDFYAKGVEAGELALGPEGFAEYAGHFWGFLETRPYMRARVGLALTLLKLGDEDGAISHFRGMLQLNPNLKFTGDIASAVTQYLVTWTEQWRQFRLSTRLEQGCAMAVRWDAAHRRGVLSTSPR
jgi:tetratricopeptide (TPR) repeat protein